MKLLFSFRGSIGRLGFIVLFFTTMVVYYSAFLFMTSNSVLYEALRTIIMLSAFLSYVSAFMRRLHDLGRANSDIFLLLIPVYNFYMLYLLFTKKGVN